MELNKATTLVHQHNTSFVRFLFAYMSEARLKKERFFALTNI